MITLHLRSLRKSLGVRVLLLLSALATGSGWSCANDPTGTTIRERWFSEQEGNSWARPVVVGDLVYFGSGDGKVYARNVASGTVRWVTDLRAGRIEGANFVARGGVVAVAAIQETVGLDAATGQILWRYAAPPDTALGVSSNRGQVSRTHLAIDDDHVYVPAWGATLSAVDRLTGVVRWVWYAGRVASDTAVAGRFRSGAAGVQVSGDTVFALVWHNLVHNVVQSEAWMLALDRRTGRELWRTTLPNPRGGAIHTAPALAGPVVVFAASSGRLAAVNRTTGQPAWAFEPPLVSSPRSGAEANADAIYADGGDGVIRAFDPATGTIKRTSILPTQLSASHDIVATTQRVYVPVGYYLFVFDRRTGRQIARLTQPGTTAETGSLFSSPVAVANGRVFVTVHQGAWSFDEP